MKLELSPEVEAVSPPERLLVRFVITERLIAIIVPVAEKLNVRNVRVADRQVMMKNVQIVTVQVT